MKLVMVIAVVSVLTGCAGEDDGTGNNLVSTTGAGGAAGMETGGTGGDGAGGTAGGTGGAGGAQACNPPTDWPLCPDDTRFAIPYTCGAGAYCTECYDASSVRATGCVLRDATTVGGKPGMRVTLTGPFFCTDGTASQPGVVPGC